jgi:hypothetical protein
MTKQPLTTPFLTVGWQEWVALPELGLPAIKAKIDTGAKTSALHAAEIVEFKRHRQRWVRFQVDPLQDDKSFVLPCEARVVDQRSVTNSGGQSELRYVIKTNLQLGGHSWEIELTLTNRDTMAFRMLLGREALSHRAIIDPSHITVQGRLSKQRARKRYLKAAKR